MSGILHFQLLSTIFTLNIITAFDQNVNNSEVFVSYSGHSEAENNLPVLIPKSETDKDYDRHSIPEARKETTELDIKPAEDVVFVPNEKPVFRQEDEYLENDRVDITDVIGDRKVDVADITEKASEDILFLSGKNNENIEHDETKNNRHTDSFKKTKDMKRKKLDCSHLDCDNTIGTVCGGKMDDKKWKYRLFLNDCFFRKVNCAFKYPNNRYKLVGMEKCTHIGKHSNRRPPSEPVAMHLIAGIEETRRIFSSRRSLNANINGQACSHPCPLACTERYEPQCAVSSTGQRHTFLNHCKLDYNSCLNRVVWYIRPLSECVGGRKADVQENRGFIAWMQKVGIVDSRGRLTLPKAPRPR